MTKVRTMVLCAIFAALMGICSWISIPTPGGSFTLQLFAVFLALEILGGRRGCISILTWLLLGFVGLPIFSGFRGGAGILLGPTGGFLLGFPALGLGCWLLTALGTKPLYAMLLSLPLCYGFGLGWYCRLCGVSFHAGFLTCVAPFLIPDGVKLWLAHSLAGKLKKHIAL